MSGEDGYNKPFAVRLRNLLEDNKITQEELASFVGVKRQSVSSWKDGKTVPDIESLFKMCKRFEVCADYLIGLSDDPQRKPSAVDQLGLTPEATQTLVDCYTRDKTNSITLTVNALIEHRYALGAISRYLYYNLDDKEPIIARAEYEYAYKSKSASNLAGWGDFKPPIDFGSPELINDDMYKQLLLLRIQEQLVKLLESESIKAYFTEGGISNGN